MILLFVMAISLLVNGFEPRQKVTCYQKFVGDPTKPSDFWYPPSRKKKESSKNDTEYIIHHSNEVKFPGARDKKWTKFCYNCVADSDCEGETLCKIHPYMQGGPRKCCNYPCKLYITDDPQPIDDPENVNNCIHVQLEGRMYCKIQTSWCLNPTSPGPWTTTSTIATMRPTVPLPPSPIDTQQMMTELMNCVKYKLRRSKRTSNCNQVSEKLYKKCALIVKDRFALPLPDG